VIEPSPALSDLFDLAVNECTKAKRNHALAPFVALQEPAGGRIVELVAESNEAAVAKAQAVIEDAGDTIRAYAIAYDGVVQYETGEPIAAFIVELAERGGADGVVMFQRYEWVDGDVDLIHEPHRVLRPTSPRFR
jgi:hypothetical protein